MLTYYFDKKLGRVSGISSSGSSVTFMILPPIFHILISYFHWQGALLISAGIVAHIGVCGALFRPTHLEIKARSIFNNLQTGGPPQRNMSRKISVIEAPDLPKRKMNRGESTVEAADLPQRRRKIGVVEAPGLPQRKMSGRESVVESADQPQRKRSRKISVAETPNLPQRKMSRRESTVEAADLPRRKSRKISVAEAADQPQRKISKAESVVESVVEAADLTLFKKVYFFLGLIAFFLYGLAYIIPTHYLASRAKNIGYSDESAAYLVSSIGIGSFVSRLTHGVIIDHHILTVTSFTSLSYIICCVSNFLIPQSNAYPALVTCAVLIGIASGVFHSTIPMIAKDYVGLDRISGGLGWLMFLNGCGAILGSYLTGKSIRFRYDT